ncbi:hypothetical protein GCM10015535_55700 [Streptomyces gelaticus]|uniref:ABC transporter permease n=1 Tax=Streptomyces gelaticus TaxID=285446 RepID=A0ABQ2W5Z2_9ACTN|nr:hypothetical protein [Streptomyces gelaticus]GGV93166.1 hypothetical protein GCM10015535_55700 [Streptomyces gelaticus]
MIRWDAERQQWDPAPARQLRLARAGVLERRLRTAAVVLAMTVLGAVAAGGALLAAQHG